MGRARGTSGAYVLVHSANNTKVTGKLLPQQSSVLAEPRFQCQETPEQHFMQTQTVHKVRQASNFLMTMAIKQRAWPVQTSFVYA